MKNLKFPGIVAHNYRASNGLFPLIMLCSYLGSGHPSLSVVKIELGLLICLLKKTHWQGEGHRLMLTEIVFCFHLCIIVDSV